MRVFNGLGLPRLIIDRPKPNVGHIFDLEIPIEVHSDLTLSCAHYILHNGTSEDKNKLFALAIELAELAPVYGYEGVQENV